jgi:uncharacterized SAM-binding protein YcdF (DUF218 family)
MKRNAKWFGLSILLLFFLCVGFQQTHIASIIHENILNDLTSINNLPAKKTFDSVYILGGDQESLKSKYKFFSTLYFQGCCKEIVILSRPGITEYSSSLKRNMTNDEWSCMIFDNYGISAEEIQMLQVETDFFGTYTEAEFLTRMAEQKSWKSLLLITSPHHTKRVTESFTRSVEKNKLDLDIWVTASNEKVGLFELFLELFKLKFYQMFLLT